MRAATSAPTAFPLFIPSARHILLALGMAAGTALTAVAALMLGALVDALVAGASPAPVLLAYLALAVTSGLASFFLAQWLPMRRNLCLESESSIQTLDLALALSSRAAERHGRAELLSLITTGSFSYGDAALVMSIQVPGSVLCVAALIVAAALVSPWLVAFVLADVVAYVALVDRPSTRSYEEQCAWLPRREEFLDGCRRVVEEKRAANASAAEAFYQGRFDASADRYLERQRRYQLVSTLAANLPAAVSGVMQVAAVAVCLALFAAGQIGLGGFLVAWQLATLLQEPATNLCKARSFYAANRAYVEQLRGVAAAAAEPSGFERLTDGAGDAVAAGAGAAPRLVAHLSDGSLFSTPDRVPEHLLFHVDDLAIPAGALVVVKGANGSGKSMLLDFLRGLSDADDFDGTARLAPELAHAAYLTYPIPLVSGTLEENLLGGPIDPEVAAMLDLSSFAEKDIDDRVVNLSFGERQKLGLLRALSRTEPVVLLDEPLTNLDHATIGRLCRYLKGLRGEKTVVAVMHSPELDEAADLVLEIRDHRLVCVGGALAGGERHA